MVANEAEMEVVLADGRVFVGLRGIDLAVSPANAMGAELTGEAFGVQRCT